MDKIIKKPKIIFIDLDGTSLDIKDSSHSNFSLENINAIEEVSKEIPIIVSTGRGYNSETLRILKTINAKNFILWNGAKIFIDNKEVVSKKIDEQVLHNLLLDISKSKVLGILNSDLKKSFTNSIIFKIIDVFKGFKNNDNYLNTVPFDTFKVLVFAISKRKLSKLKAEWSEKYKGVLQIAFCGKQNSIIEITSVTASKGISEKEYCEMFGIDPENAMHIGDSMNDASAKNMLGTVVAMKNSSDLFKDIADIVLDFDYKNAGLAKFIRQFVNSKK
ncbi:HAD-IIB family hydrolase [Mycoplasmopsis anatis]|uniref:COF family haloacid dehalogenase(HAD)-like hydrolase n=1 Tax=Mycoplasmopsis anatis 1340 TaxID=1034808 RepID=F9QD59_9BACT|nr:HAD-IIB family hydrolase [Mycoplasmopsis anatis]AWX70243.1 HAD-IIB family hydrolase [Mycoplasmopsis anatis]EGS29317.1 COF family haloacid dehalogenase(HAD)-like hydrolase [Mycoplasmopsis anatis 1340]VEU74114.1 COF family HAD hydrolase protein [Mycoplasmopsis anatis]